MPPASGVKMPMKSEDCSATAARRRIPSSARRRSVSSRKYSASPSSVPVPDDSIGKELISNQRPSASSKTSMRLRVRSSALRRSAASWGRRAAPETGPRTAAGQVVAARAAVTTSKPPLA
jgi:hypothetical protein